MSGAAGTPLTRRVTRPGAALASRPAGGLRGRCGRNEQRDLLGCR
jgi:hypothetical protein